MFEYVIQKVGTRANGQILLLQLSPMLLLSTTPSLKAVLELCHELPRSLFLTDEDYRAALVHEACTDGVLFIHDIIAYFMAGKHMESVICMLLVCQCSSRLDIATEVTELKVAPSNRLKHVKMVPGEEAVLDEDVPGHEVHKICMWNTTYIMDLSGAQFGYHDISVPCHECMSTRADVVPSEVPLGTAQRALRNLLLEESVQAYELPYHALHDKYDEKLGSMATISVLCRRNCNFSGNCLTKSF